MMDFPQPQMIAVNGVTLEVFTAGTGSPLCCVTAGQNMRFPGAIKFSP